MGFFTLLLLAIGMSVDAFAAALARGAGCLQLNWRDTLKIACVFGTVESITPIIGWLAGSAAQQYIADYDHWLAFILLSVLGGKMIWGAQQANTPQTNTPQRAGSLLMTLSTAIATSIDSMVVGVGLAFLDVNIWLTALTIGLATTLMATLGLHLGCILGKRAGSRAEMVGGMVLIGIGISILFEHMGWL